MIKQKKMSAGEKIAWAYRSVTSRQPRQQEIDILLDDLKAYQIDFQKNPDAAKKVLSIGEKPFDKSLNPTELAAYAFVANTILNLDESITKE